MRQIVFLEVFLMMFWNGMIVWKQWHQFHRRKAVRESGMHLIHHHMMSVAAVHSSRAGHKTLENMGGDIMMTSLHHRWANGGEDNKHLISIGFLSWHFLPHWIRSATNQKMIPCLLDTKKLLILLTWTQYKIHWYLSTLDLWFIISHLFLVKIKFWLKVLLSFTVWLRLHFISLLYFSCEGWYWGRADRVNWGRDDSCLFRDKSHNSLWLILTLGTSLREQIRPDSNCSVGNLVLAQNY